MKKIALDRRNFFAEVYLADEVDARIAVLEKALAQIAIGADGDAINEDDALTYNEIEQIALAALGRPVIQLRAPDNETDCP